MDVVLFYLKEGFFHITDINGYDHILFIISISLIINPNIKRLIYIVSFFTLAHSLSLILAVLNIISIQASIIEVLIPVTIVFSSLFNLLYKEKFHVEQNKWLYLMVFVFGLIHGLGFSNYLRLILHQQESLFLPLLSFNIGLEMGQIILLLLLVLILKLYTLYFKNYNYLHNFGHTMVILIALKLILERI